MDLNVKNQLWQNKKTPLSGTSYHLFHETLSRPKRIEGKLLNPLLCLLAVNENNPIHNGLVDSLPSSCLS